MSHELAQTGTQIAAADEWAFLDRQDGERPSSAYKPQEYPNDGHLHGFVHGMSYEEYAKVDALNASRIVNMRRSAMYYRHKLDNPSETTPALEFGTAVHRQILEPATVGEIAIWGELEAHKTRRGGVWEKFQADNAGKTIMTLKDYTTMIDMATAVLNNEPIRKYAHADGPTEVCMFWRDQRTGRRMKARLDKIIPSTHTLPDLKTTRDARTFRFPSQAFQLGYITKMAHYWDGYRTLKGVEPSLKLLAMEKPAPHESVVYDIPRDITMIGLEERDTLIDQIEECEASGKWPARELMEVTMTIPPFASMEADTEFELDV